jgi:hypothetical protein
VGLQVELSTGETGVIESSFGQSGKVKIRIPGMYILSRNTSVSVCSLVGGDHLHPSSAGMEMATQNWVDALAE